jgi:hypothetical protein
MPVRPTAKDLKISANPIRLSLLLATRLPQGICGRSPQQSDFFWLLIILIISLQYNMLEFIRSPLVKRKHEAGNISRVNDLPTVITHTVVAVSSGYFFKSGKMPLKFWLLSIACSVLPDADVIGYQYFYIPYNDLFGHRGFFHYF